MTETVYRVVVLAVEDGSAPFDVWLGGLRDRAARTRVYTRLSRLQTGNFGDHRERIAGAVSELRIDYGPGYRIYYAQHAGTLIVLLGGGVKDGQQADVAAAVSLWEGNKDNAERFSREFRIGSA